MVEWSVSLWVFLFFVLSSPSFITHHVLSGALKFSIYSLLHLWSFSFSSLPYYLLSLSQIFFFSSLMLLYKWHNILKLKLSGSCCVTSLRLSSSPGSWSFHLLETSLPQETSPVSNSHLLHRILKVNLFLSLIQFFPVYCCGLEFSWIQPFLQKHCDHRYKTSTWDVSQILMGDTWLPNSYFLCKTLHIHGQLLL